MYTHTLVHKHLYTNTLIHVCTHTHTFTNTHTLVHTHTHTHTRMYVHTHTQTRFTFTGVSLDWIINTVTASKGCVCTGMYIPSGESTLSTS